MSKYNITHSCGCIVTHNIVGRNVDGERERKAEYLASQPCWECKKAAGNAAAAEKNAHLPSLEGSEKQIAWAESIRAMLNEQIEKMLSQFNLAAIEVNPQFKEKYQKILDAVAKIRAQKQAAWWIDNREMKFDQNWMKKIVS